MRIGGFIKTSFVDYPGEISSVLFTKGCNLNCSYCHNAGLIDDNGTMEGIQLQDVLDWLCKRNGIINAVVISGGEPTTQSDLYDFTKQLKSRGFRIKLDTNGTNPKVLIKLIEHKLLDFVAMDLKAPLAKYGSICRVDNINLASIRESVEVIKKSRLGYEFRTTMCPELEVEDITSILSDFQITSNYIVQNCRSTQGNNSGTSKEKLGMLTQKLKHSLCCNYRGF